MKRHFCSASVHWSVWKELVETKPPAPSQGSSFRGCVGGCSEHICSWEACLWPEGSAFLQQWKHKFFLKKKKKMSGAALSCRKRFCLSITEARPGPWWFGGGRRMGWRLRRWPWSTESSSQAVAVLDGPTAGALLHQRCRGTRTCRYQPQPPRTWKIPNVVTDSSASCVVGLFACSPLCSTPCPLLWAPKSSSWELLRPLVRLGCPRWTHDPHRSLASLSL